jgi:hypothetical protein
MLDTLVKFFLWLVAIAAAIAWLLIYRQTSDSLVLQGIFVLVSILCGARLCECRKGAKGEATHG